MAPSRGEMVLNEYLIYCNKTINRYGSQLYRNVRRFLLLVLHAEIGWYFGWPVGLSLC